MLKVFIILLVLFILEALTDKIKGISKPLQLITFICYYLSCEFIDISLNWYIIPMYLFFRLSIFNALWNVLHRQKVFYIGITGIIDPARNKLNVWTRGFYLLVEPTLSLFLGGLSLYYFCNS